MARTDATQSKNLFRPTRRWGMALGAAGVLAACIVAKLYQGSSQASAQAPANPARTNRAATAQQAGPPTAAREQGAAPQRLSIMATVNGQRITRNELANACVARFGSTVLESLVNKHLIAQQLAKAGVTITRDDIHREIERIAARFRLGVDQYLDLIERERGVSYEQYARDIVWPTLALERLAAERLSIRDADIEQAYHARFGQAVKARLIATGDLATAERLRAEALANPDDFPRIARQHSIDAPSASAGGLVQPIRRFAGDRKIEDVVFALQPGEISQVVQVGDQFALFKCEGYIEPQDVPLEKVRENLVEEVRQRKLRQVAPQVFQQVQEAAVVENVYNDPAKSREMPGVAAKVNGHPLTMLELAEECLARHGESVLDGEINRRLLEQELARLKLQLSQEDLDAEIAHAATLAGVLREDNSPDIEKWLQMVTVDQGVSFDIYIQDAVWPSAALKKLAQHEARVTDEDIQKGYEANYGERVRCRAIVMSNLRRAQEVWDKARQNPTGEFFAKLAEEYSIERASGQLGGEVPPVRRHGGQPILEREAFALKPGDVSGVVQVGENFVILYCEGLTEPVEVNLADVRDHIYKDIYEKKLRFAMAERFDQLREAATIDNFLAGTTQSPQQKRALANLPNAAARAGMLPRPKK